MTVWNCFFCGNRAITTSFCPDTSIVRHLNVCTFCKIISFARRSTRDWTCINFPPSTLHMSILHQHNAKNLDCVCNFYAVVGVIKICTPQILNVQARHANWCAATGRLLSNMWWYQCLLGLSLIIFKTFKNIFHKNFLNSFQTFCKILKMSTHFLEPSIVVP